MPGAAHLRECRGRGPLADELRVMPDLGDELLIVIEDDVGLPAPFADGKALGALQTVREVVRPTQGRDEPRQEAR